jgi:hypothetical protein
MTKEQYKREFDYQTRLAVARQLLNNGIFTDADFSDIETKLRSETNPIIGSFTLPKSLDV